MSVTGINAGRIRTRLVNHLIQVSSRFGRMSQLSQKKVYRGEMRSAGEVFFTIQRCCTTEYIKKVNKHDKIWLK